MSTEKKVSRRQFLRRAAILGAGLAALAPILAACGPTPTPKVVEKVVTQVVEKPVEKVVKETVVVEKKVEVPAKAEIKKIRIFIASWVRAITPSDRVVADYVAKRPELQIVMEDAAGTEWETKVLAQVRAGKPDWSANIGSQLVIAQYVETGMVQPIEDYLKASRESGAEGILEDLHPLPKADATYKDRLYGISWRVDLDTFSYNKTFYAGVGQKEWPSTWEGIEELAAKIVAKYKDQGVWGMQFARHLIHDGGAIFYTLVKNPWTPDGILDILNPKYIDALQMLKRWQDMKLVPTPPWQDQQGAHFNIWEKAKVGMVCCPHIWGKWAAYIWGTEVISYPVPMPPTGGKTPSWATPSWLFRNAPYPQETMDFIIYTMGPKNELMIRSCIEGWGLPCYQSAFKELVPKVAGMQWQADLMKFVSDATPLAKSTTLGLQNDKIMTGVENYLLGKIADPKEAMEKTLADLKDTIAKQKVT